MKYLTLAYPSLEAWDNADYSSREFDAVCTFYRDLGAELTESGEMVTVFGLEHPVHSRSVRRRGDAEIANPHRPKPRRPQTPRVGVFVRVSRGIRQRELQGRTPPARPRPILTERWDASPSR